jgi:predicted kinase
MDNQIPEAALVLLIGQAGSGKSTLASTWPATEVLELDHYRGLVADDPGDQDATGDAVFVLESVLDARLERGLNCVVDATNTDRAVRSGLLKIAARHGMPTVALLVSTTLSEALERNSLRPANRRVPDDVVRAQHTAMINAHPGLRAEGFDHVVFADSIGRLRPLLHRVSEQQIRELGWNDDTPGAGRNLLVRRCFGPEAARLATWQDGSMLAGGAPVVVIQAGQEYLTLALRHTADGPVFEVQLPCPADEDCPGPAWLPVHSADDLLQAHCGDLDLERELACAHNPAHTPASGTDDTER